MSFIIFTCSIFVGIPTMHQPWRLHSVVLRRSFKIRKIRESGTASPFLRIYASWLAYSELSFFENSFNKLSISRLTSPYLLLICSECWTNSTPGGPINIILGGLRGALLSLSIRCLAISSTIFFFYKSLPSSSIIPPLNYYLTPSILTRYSVIASLAI